MALGATHTLFAWVVHDNMTEVNERSRAVPVCFREAVEDGIRQGATSALAVMHFHFLG